MLGHAPHPEESRSGVSKDGKGLMLFTTPAYLLHKKETPTEQSAGVSYLFRRYRFSRREAEALRNSAISMVSDVA